MSFPEGGSLIHNAGHGTINTGQRARRNTSVATSPNKISVILDGPRVPNTIDHEQPVEITLEEAYQGTSRGFTLGNQRGTLDIPAGVADGTRVCYRGKGAPSMRGGLPGDLYLKVAIQPHPHFTCKGKNLETHIAVDLYTAILGGEVTVPLLTGGEGRLRIAPETPNGKKLRWRGKGMPIRGQEATYGDLDVVVDVVLPVALSDEERALFQQLKTLREKK